MLNHLLDYEYKATRRVYGGLYMALLVVAVLLGLSMRGMIEQSRILAAPVVVLSLVYAGLMIAMLAVLAITIIERFAKNLLGREGYLMHTLPVTTRQLIGAKLISALVWVLLSLVVFLVSAGLLGIVSSLSLQAMERLGESFAVLWRWAAQNAGTTLNMMLAVLITVLAVSAAMILRVYAACMVGHLFKRHAVPVGILAFFGLSLAENAIVTVFGLLGLGGASGLLEQSLPGLFQQMPAAGLVWTAALTQILPAAVFGVVYFFLTDWLMRSRLNLE